MALEKFFLIGQ